MDHETLVNGEIDAGAQFIVDFDDYAPISVAFWLHPIESEQPYLYIASDRIDGTNFDVAYGEMLRRFREKDYDFDRFRIKVVNSSEWVARDAKAIRDRFPNRTTPTRFRGTSLGGIPMHDAIIYPPVAKLRLAA